MSKFGGSTGNFWVFVLRALLLFVFLKKMAEEVRIGDVTTTMLWVQQKISTAGTTFLPEGS